MILEINSTKNEKFKAIKALKNKKERDETGLYTVEGIKSCRDALDAGCEINIIVMSDNFEQKDEFIADSNCDIYIADKNIFPLLSDTKTPQGIIAVIKQENKTIKPDKSKIYIYLDKVTDPGNAGTIIRTADASGMGGILLSDGCVDIYNPKTVRSSMGSFFHTKMQTNATKSDLLKLKEEGFKIVCGILSEKTVTYTDVDFTQPVVIVLGNEANGISEEILEISDIDVKIPIIGKAESLNVAVAGAIFMYEAVRQRNKPIC